MIFLWKDGAFLDCCLFKYLLPVLLILLSLNLGEKEH